MAHAQLARILLSAMALDWISNSPREVIDFVQEGLPYYEFINPQIFRRIGENIGDMGENGTLYNVASPTTILSELLMWLTPTIVVIILLVITCLGIYIAACCYPCCRAKGHCCVRGNENLKSCHNCKFCVCLVISSLFILSLLFGVGIGLLANNHASSSIRNLPDSLLSAFEDGFDYVNDTVTEILFAVIDQRDMVIASANSDLQNIDTELLEPVVDTLEPLFMTVHQNTSNLLDNLESSLAEVEAINATIEDLYDQLSQLNSTLSSLQSIFRTFFASCGGNVACEEAVPLVPSINTIDDLIDTVETTNILGDVDIDATREHLMNSTMILNNITSQINDGASDFNISTNDTLLSFVNSVEAFRDTVNRDNEDGAFTSFANSLNATDRLIEDYEVFRLSAGMVLNGIFLSIALTFLIGITVGVVGCRKKREPHLRSRLSHCGGTAIYGGIVASFLLSGVLLLSSTPLYFVATLLQKTCNDLAPPQYVLLATTVDNTSLFGGSTLLGSLLTGALNESTLRVSISRALSECENNKPLFQALQFDESINITEYLLRRAEMSEEDMVDMLDFGSLADTTLDEVLSEATRRSIEDVPESLDPGRVDSLNQPVLDISLEALVLNLTDLADIFMLMGMPSEADMVIMVRDNLVRDQVNNSIRAIETKKVELKAELQAVNNSLQNTMVQADDLLILLYIFHNETATVLRTELLEFVRQMSGYFSAYSRYLANTIENEIGRCEAVPEAYKAIYSSVCTDFLDGINVIWLSIVLCVCACIALIIAGTAMAVFFRRGSLLAALERATTATAYGRHPRSPHFPAPPPPSGQTHPRTVPSVQSLEYPSAPPQQPQYGNQPLLNAQVPPDLPGQVPSQPVVSFLLPTNPQEGSLPPSFSELYPSQAPSTPQALLGHLLVSATPSGLPPPIDPPMRVSLSVSHIGQPSTGQLLNLSPSLPLFLHLPVHVGAPATTPAATTPAATPAAATPAATPVTVTIIPATTSTPLTTPATTTPVAIIPATTPAAMTPIPVTIPASTTAATTIPATTPAATTPIPVTVPASTTAAATIPATTPAATTPIPVTTPVSATPLTTPAATTPLTTPAATTPATAPATSTPVTAPASTTPATTRAAITRAATTPLATTPLTTPAATTPATTPGTNEVLAAQPQNKDDLSNLPHPSGHPILEPSNSLGSLSDHSLPPHDAFLPSAATTGVTTPLTAPVTQVSTPCTTLGTNEVLADQPQNKDNLPHPSGHPILDTEPSSSNSLGSSSDHSLPPHDAFLPSQTKATSIIVETTPASTTPVTTPAPATNKVLADQPQDGDDLSNLPHLFSHPVIPIIPVLDTESSSSEPSKETSSSSDHSFLPSPTTPINIIEATPTQIIKTTPTGIIQTMDTDITETQPTDIIQAPPTSIETFPTDIIQAPPTDSKTLPTDIIQGSPSDLIQAPLTLPIDIIQTLPTQILQTPPTQIIPYTTMGEVSWHGQVEKRRSSDSVIHISHLTTDHIHTLRPIQSNHF